MKEELLGVFTRYPEPGKTKTRLIPALGSDSAACLQRAMTAHILKEAAMLENDRGTRVEIRFEGGDEVRMREMFGESFVYRHQGDGNLGDRMHRCFCDSLESGAKRVAIVGSDIPGVDCGILSTAFDRLQDHDLVIGPASDGGYYLIGLRADVQEVFLDIPWGTENVFRWTLDIADRCGLSVCTLPVLSDIDRPEDLVILEQMWDKARMKEAIGRVSVIIPSLNEASRIEGVLKGLREDDPNVEIIVVDGGSTDGTAARAEACAAKVLISEPGRARQMNAGAAAATGGILLFLHADTQLPTRFSTFVRGEVNRPDVSAGAFTFRLDADGRAYRILERLVNWRSRVLQMPYGDQALFMKAGVFTALGGFPDLPIMEDYEMVRRLKRRGRITIAPVPAVTSARRWKDRGILRTAFRHQWLIVGYLLGIPPRCMVR